MTVRRMTPDAKMTLEFKHSCLKLSLSTTVHNNALDIGTKLEVPPRKEPRKGIGLIQTHAARVGLDEAISVSYLCKVRTVYT